MFSPKLSYVVFFTTTPGFLQGEYMEIILNYLNVYLGSRMGYPTRRTCLVMPRPQKAWLLKSSLHRNVTWNHGNSTCARLARLGPVYLLVTSGLWILLRSDRNPGSPLNSSKDLPLLSHGGGLNITLGYFKVQCFFIAIAYLKLAN